MIISGIGLSSEADSLGCAITSISAGDAEDSSGRGREEEEEGTASGED